MINQPEGYLEPNGQGGYDYGYQIKDHLGNIRSTFVDYDDNGSIALSEITEENNYYPFGLKHQGYNNIISSNANAVATKFKYNGKELNDELNLDWYDYGFRYYDAALARFTTIDPLTEKNHSQSGFVYAANNPIKYIDYMGLDSAQRANAVAQAEQYVSQKADGNQYLMGGKGAPGEKVDCSGLVSNSVVAGGESDPNHGSETSGVLNIENNTTKVSESDAMAGNIVTFRKSTGYAYHTGMVKDIVRDSDGNITSVTYIQSSGGVGPNEATFEVGNSGNLSINGFYKWDTKPDAAPATTAASTATQSMSAVSGTRGSSSVGIGTSIRSAWSNFTYQVSSGMSQMENWVRSGYR